MGHWIQYYRYNLILFSFKKYAAMGRKRTGLVILVLIICLYAFMYTDTKTYSCSDDCQKIYALDTTLMHDRDYIFGVYRCSRNSISDTICIIVKDTTGVNWDLFADTVCAMATQKGLNQQKLFIIKNGSFPLDTLVKKQCP